MAGAFQLLRSNDLIWSRRLRHYLLDIPDRETDLMSWNADATRMPYRMHADYLHRLFLRNSLASSRYLVDEQGKFAGFGEVHLGREQRALRRR